MKLGTSLALVALSLLAGCKSDDAITGKAEDTVEVTAVVSAVDVPKRTLTVTSERGNQVLVEVSPAVKNLAQVHVGDTVAVTYTAAVSWKVRPASESAPVAASHSTVDVAKAGEKPAMHVGDSVTITTTITAIDVAGGTVTLTGPRGNTIVVEPKNRDNLKKVAVGDHVDISYSEAFAVGVRPTPAPAKK